MAATVCGGVTGAKKVKLAAAILAEDSLADRLGHELVVGLGAQNYAGFVKDPVQLPGRDVEPRGDLGLAKSLASEIDSLDLLFRQFWHKRIESSTTLVFKSPALGTGLVGRSELTIRKVNRCQS